MAAPLIERLEALIGTPRDGALLRFSLGSEHLKAGGAAIVLTWTESRRSCRSPLWAKILASSRENSTRRMKTAILSKDAPAAIGTYSQAIRAGDTLYISGQIGLDASTMQLVDGIDAQIDRVFRNLGAIALAAGLDLQNAVRMTVYLTDLAHFARVNEVMQRYLREPYPARAAIGVASLPRGALVEIDAILYAG